MIVSVSGTVDGHSLPPKGGEVDLPDHVAADLCGSGHAVPLATQDDVETAVAPEVDVEERAEPEAGIVDALRAQAESLRIKVDRRWGADRLRDEVAKAAGDQ